MLANKRIILVGKGGSRKDWIRRKFESRGFKYAVSCTTRPMRDGEIDGVDYYFISRLQFTSMIEDHLLYSWNSYKDGEWFYGTSKEEFYSSDIFIMTPDGINQLKQEDRQSSFVIYIDVNEATRKSRLETRIDADVVKRRLESDEKDFSTFTNYDLMI